MAEIPPALVDYLHEIRLQIGTLNAAAQSLSQALKGETLDVPRAKFNSEQVIQATYTLATTNLLIDFLLNPEGAAAQHKWGKKNVFEKFRNAEQAHRSKAAEKNIDVRFTGNSIPRINAIDLIDVVPMNLLSNAIKYAPRSSRIDIELVESSRNVEAVISSLGPRLLPTEQNEILGLGFRGENAKKVELGSGRGLHLVDQIVRLHGGTVSIERRESLAATVSGVEYANFVLRLSLPIGEP
jgi:signal transduction histidine kinase